MKPQNLSALLEGCKKKERCCQKKIYELYFTQSLSMCNRYTKDCASALVLLNESFKIIFDTIVQYDIEISFECWIKKTVINVISKKITNEVKRVTIKEFHDEGLLKKRHDLPKALSYEDCLSLLRSLDVEYCTVYNFYVMEEMSTEQIAKLFNVHEQKIRFILHEARTILQSALKC